MSDLRLGIADPGPVDVPPGDGFVHTWTLGMSGSGKTGWLMGLALSVLGEHPDVDVTIVDPKGDMVPNLLADFLPAAHGSLHGVDPRSVLVIEPFGPFGVPMGLLAHDATVDPAVQAFNTAHLVAGLSDGALGARMQHVLQGVFGAILAHPHGALVDAPRLLTSEPFRLAYANDVRTATAAEYLRVGFAEEPATSVGAVLARIDNLLVVASVRAMIGGTQSIDPMRLVDGPRLVLVDLGGAPQGMVPIANLVGSFVFSKLTGAIFARKSRRRRLVIVDEWQVLAKHCPSDFERVLALARSKGVSLFLANQDAAQVRAASVELEQSLLANAGRRLLFCPEPEDAATIVKSIEPTGRIIDPRRPDRRLDASEERALMLRRLSTLPRRHCIVVDRLGRGTFEMRSLNVPYTEAKEIADERGEGLRAAYRRGSDGVPMADLLRDVDRVVAPPTHDDEPADDPVFPRAAKPRSRQARPRLVLP